MRLYDLAKSLNIPHRDLLDALREEGLGVRFGSPMTHVLDEDLPEIFHACMKHLPDVVLDPAQLEQARGFARQKDDVKARARDATMEARLPQAIPEPVPATPRDESWSTFMDEVGVVAGGGQLRTATRLGYDSGHGEVRLLPEPVSSRRAMARRRAAVDTLYASYGAFDNPVVLDVFLYEVSESLQAELHEGKPALIDALQRHLEYMFPIQLDEDDFARGIATNSPSVTSGLTFDEVAERLRFDFDVAEQLGKYSSVDAFDDEEFQELEQMIRGDTTMNYRRLKQIFEDEQLTMQSALPHELLRSDAALVEMARTHLVHDEDLTLIDLFGSNENSRYACFIVASAQHAIGHVTARQL